jgi:hypothetical protein
MRVDINGSEKCKRCIYSMWLALPKAGYWAACDYLGQTGKRRPCEAGDDCTVFVRRPKEKE